MEDRIQWNDRFNIGEEIVDKAHQKLFSIVRKMIALNEDEEKQRHACRETIKYFKSYTIRHFAEEEAYMKSINYGGYATHKHLHDDLRDKTLPALEKELEEQDYSSESVQHFLGICIGWLTGHIMIEDRAITGRVANKWVNSPEEGTMPVLEKAVDQVMKEVFGLKTWLVSEHYGGEEFGKGVFLRFTYLSKKHERFQIFLAYEEHMILYTLSEMVGKKIHKVDRTVIHAIKQLSKKIVERIGMLFEPLDVYQLERENFLKHEQLLKAFEKEYPRYSLLYGTEGNGYFAFCIK